MEEEEDVGPPKMGGPPRPAVKSSGETDGRCWPTAVDGLDGGVGGGGSGIDALVDDGRLTTIVGLAGIFLMAGGFSPGVDARVGENSN